MSVISTWEQYDRLVHTEGCHTEFPIGHQGEKRLCGTECSECAKIDYCMACADLIYEIEQFENRQLKKARAESTLQRRTIATLRARLRNRRGAFPRAITSSDKLWLRERFDAFSNYNTPGFRGSAKNLKDVIRMQVHHRIAAIRKFGALP